ncbi:MAG: folylpolyglutamate synthase/dihydrofolate synthase [Actinomycetia bacterium]|nr:folylpolyglutamate synthase/dihydrofolate synthase [Actinomycetes bacterium]
MSDDIVAMRAWLDAHMNLEALGVPNGQTRRTALPTLARIEALTELLGSPQSEFPAIHITGTNGKTSVTRMVGALLRSTGLSTGTYTSPHLERVNERMTWEGEPIRDEDLAALLALVAAVEPHLDEVPSWFEIMTAVALRWFADVAVEVAAIEVGLGGRWDATNVVDGRVAVISNVDVDHTDFLGPTRADIAAEKAGIIKPGADLVLGETDPELELLFLEREPGRVFRRGVDFGVLDSRRALGGRVLDLYTPGGTYRDVFLPLHGAHQADNAALALMSTQAFLDGPPSEDVVLDAFAAVRTPGRLEVVGHQPLVLLDGAHNVAGAHALVQALHDEFPEAPRTLVVGFLREKDAAEMLEALGVHDAQRIVCCAPPSPRARDPREIADAAYDLGVPPEAVTVIDDVREAVTDAIDEAGDDGQVVITGSLYLVGAARAVLVRD